MKPDPFAAMFLPWGLHLFIGKLIRKQEVAKEAEVKAADQCVKSTQLFCNILGELDLIDLSTAQQFLTIHISTPLVVDSSGPDI